MTSYLILIPKVLELGKFVIPLPRERRRILLEKFKKKLKKVNTEYKERSPLDPKLRDSLKQEFAPEIERLSSLLGRDLTYWSRN
ncbi:MAG: hypothetical protein QNJ41_24795 [Xenococcaceae cyanobacterium MO_188.B32]|nr:hypothetical protein [Xenococcaceae cyanobacterium MO_188.B32]